MSDEVEEQPEEEEVEESTSPEPGSADLVEDELDVVPLGKNRPTARRAGDG